MSEPTRSEPRPRRVRRARTPSGAANATPSRWRKLPSDVLAQSCKRIGIMALIFAILWTLPIVLNNVVHGWLHHMPLERMGGAGWPMPGNLIAGIGIAVSAGMVFLARSLQTRPALLLRYGLVYEVAMATLVSLVTHLDPVPRLNGISWLCLIIVTYPAIVPSTPRTTFFVSLLIASLDPLFYGAALARGLPISTDPFTLAWQWLPNYAAVGIAVVPASIITGLGRQVSKARDLGAYELQEQIGRGGMGEVYRARHRFLARPAAVKLIRAEALGRHADQAVLRFRREAQAAASLRSPHTISLYDFGRSDDGVFYYAMELLEGLDFDRLVRRFGPVSAERAIVLLRQACRSLGEAHATGLIHRDIKPSNVFTCRLGLNVDFVKVLDFGLVKAIDRQAPGSTLLTAPDVTTGTPAFMAPEMATAEPDADGRADLYALGCVGYWLLTGRLVFEAESPVKMMLQHIQAEPVPPSRVTEVDVPPELDRVLLACLAKRPEDRPRSAHELARLLEAVPLRDPWTAERAEAWWERHLPAAAPATVLREETPVTTLHIAREEGTPTGSA